jgi:replicative DNA helicase
MREKPPPSEIKIEESVLSSVLLFEEHRPDAFEILDADDFHSTVNQIIFGKCKELYDSGHPIGIDSVWAELNDDQQKKLGGVGKLSKLIQEIPVSTDIHFHSKILKDRKARRRILEFINSIEKRTHRKNGDLRKIEKDATLIINEIQHTKAKESKAFTIENTKVSGVLTERPSDPEYLIKFKDQGLISRGIVGSLAAGGGTGKTQVLIQLSHACASGGSFAYFSTDKPLKVLLLAAEEQQDDLDRRLWDACGGDFPPNLFARSIKGVVGPLMYLDGNQPQRSEWWHWLDQTIANHKGLDLLILDPKSRLYGLDENSNDHNTQWIASLETLTIRHKLSILFSHHVPKGTNEINQWMARGGSALIDACRSNLGMVQLSHKEGEKLNIDDWKNYLKIGISKINIGPKDQGDAYLKFDDAGKLHPVNIYVEHTRSSATHFLFLLGQEKTNYSRRELVKLSCAKHVIDKMSAAFPSFVRSRDVNPMIDYLLDEGLLIETASETSRRDKLVLKIPGENG